MLIPTCMIKLMELTLAIACLVLHHYSYDLTDIPTLMICSGTYIGYIVVFSGEVIAEAVSASADAYVDAWWSASGSAMFAACGYLTLRGWREVPECARRSVAQAAAACALAASAMLILDALLAYCSAHRDDTVSRTASKSKPCS